MSDTLKTTLKVVVVAIAVLAVAAIGLTLLGGALWTWGGGVESNATVPG